MRLCIAIPTYNRASQLQIALEAIQKLKVPRGVKLTIALGNVASTDNTYELVKSLSGKKRFFVNNKLNQPENSNLAMLITKLSNRFDWVWLHGDDDIIIDKDALIKIKKAAEISDEHSLILLRNPGVGKEVCGKQFGTLIDIAEKVGLHQLLGWFSQIIIRGNVLLKAFEQYNVAHFGVKGVEHLLAKKISPYLHMFSIFNKLRYNQIYYTNLKLIVEQGSYLEQSIHYAAKRQDRDKSQFRERIFFIAEELSNISPNSNKKGYSQNFFWYVNKSFFDLMLNIMSEDNKQMSEAKLSLNIKVKYLYKLFCKTEDRGNLAKFKKTLQSSMD